MKAAAHTFRIQVTGAMTFWAQATTLTWGRPSPPRTAVKDVTSAQLSLDSMGFQTSQHTRGSQCSWRWHDLPTEASGALFRSSALLERPSARTGKRGQTTLDACSQAATLNLETFVAWHLLAGSARGRFTGGCLQLMQQTSFTGKPRSIQPGRPK